jgi:hypothetical protein
MTTFNGQESVSRQTHISGRSLLTLSISILVLKYTSVDMTAVEFMGTVLGEYTIKVGATVALCALLFSHLLNWLGDRLSFSKWNIGKPWGPKEPLVGKPSRIQEIEQFISAAKNIQRTIGIIEWKGIDAQKRENEARLAIEDLTHILPELPKTLHQFRSHLVRVGTVTFIEIYLWHGFMCFASGMWAIAALWLR